eukprot:Lithocolla_globosa_v1_NODE_4417_length_1439_cov_14.143064.p1 type:complete len:294 gc:universal NODE_4417_length_1439_cov_14.143064:83-964(+)
MQQNSNCFPSPFDQTCFLQPKALTKQQCQDLWENRFKDPEKIEGYSSSITRVVDRCGVDDSVFAQWLQEQLMPGIPRRYKVEVEDPALGPFSEGEWSFSFVFPRIQLFNYSVAGHFSVHHDGPIYYSPHKRSLFTVLIYLNEEYEGGRTVVYTDDMKQSYEVPNNLGTAFTMLQRMKHQGSPVISGQKFALRCDLIYERNVHSEEEQKGNIERKDEKEREQQEEQKKEEQERELEAELEKICQGLDRKQRAVKWFELAGLMEDSRVCNLDLCVQYYKKAYRLDPDVKMPYFAG